jgi:hypothetical protein
MREHIGEVGGFGVDVECFPNHGTEDDTVWFYPCRLDGLPDDRMYIDVTFGLSIEQAKTLAGLLLVAVKRDEDTRAVHKSEEVSDD